MLDTFLQPGLTLLCRHTAYPLGDGDDGPNIDVLPVPTETKRRHWRAKRGGRGYKLVKP
jgi:hypothetical protein